jgi:quercetin dioxygenase-like cupin family protein
MLEGARRASSNTLCPPFKGEHKGVSKMNHFPDFMKHPANLISSQSQFSRSKIEGYIFDGSDGSQMAFWECHEGGSSAEHTHEYAEYFIVVQGQYTLIVGEKKIPVNPGQEYWIPRGVPHAGEYLAGTRTIHHFGGHRADRAANKI